MKKTAFWIIIALCMLLTVQALADTDGTWGTYAKPYRFYTKSTPKQKTTSAEEWACCGHIHTISGQEINRFHGTLSGTPFEVMIGNIFWFDKPVLRDGEIYSNSKNHFYFLKPSNYQGLKGMSLVVVGVAIFVPSSASSPITLYSDNFYFTDQGTVPLKMSLSQDRSVKLYPGQSAALAVACLYPSDVKPSMISLADKFYFSIAQTVCPDEK